VGPEAGPLEKVTGFFLFPVRFSMVFSVKLVALAAIGSAAAFSPMMSVAPSRRAAISGAGAALVAAPLLRPTEAHADNVSLPGKF